MEKFSSGLRGNQTLELYVGTHTEYSGSVFGQLTQSVAAGETTLEIKGLTTSGPYAVGDVVIAGTQSRGDFVSGVQDAILHEDGTFTRITLANGVATDLDAAFHIIATVGSVDLETGEYTSGGRGSLKTIDLVNNAAGALRGYRFHIECDRGLKSSTIINLNRLEYTVSNLMNVSEFTAAFALELKMLTLLQRVRGLRRRRCFSRPFEDRANAKPKSSSLPKLCAWSLIWVCKSET